GIPLGAEKCVIERDKALDLIDEIKAHFPNELAEAKRLVDARAEFITSAKKEAESIRKSAEERARQLVDEQEIIRVAKARGNEIVTNAEATASELKRAANEYVDDAMLRTEEALAAALEEMRQTRGRFRSSAGALSKQQRTGRDYDTGRIDIDVDH
ncbi:MAG: ATP synthase F0 subunit B, partial [Clostridiales bacterium]|nr:ATP synthase F0 subunit B [Clostridiales bacterium]